jgi:hypothetical protein
MQQAAARERSAQSRQRQITVNPIEARSTPIVLNSDPAHFVLNLRNSFALGGFHS